MKLNQIVELDIVTDETEIFIRDENSHLLAKGNWYKDSILHRLDCKVESFTWHDDNNLYIDLKQED